MLEIDKDFEIDELDSVLWRVYSKRKRRELKNILCSGDPSHFERVYLVGFLAGAAGYSYEEILDIIREHNCWVDYDERITAYQVSSVLELQNHERPSLPSSSPKGAKESYEVFLRIHRNELIGLDEEEKTAAYHSWVAKYVKGMKLEDAWGVRGV
jgi:DNA primase large subunit